MWVQLVDELVDTVTHVSHTKATEPSPVQEAWWQPHGKSSGMTLAFIAMLAFGSFQNLQKSAGRRLSPLHFFADLCIGQAAMGLLLFEIPGKQAFSHLNIEHVFMAILGGLLHGLANLLLTVGVSLAGLSIAFPICNGLALTIGTLHTYWIDRRGRFPCIVAGAALACVAVLAQSCTYSALKQDQENNAKKSKEPPDAPSSQESDKGAAAATLTARADPEPKRMQALIFCVLAGLFMAVRTPVYTFSMEPQKGLSPFFGEMLFTMSSAFTCFPGFWLDKFLPPHEGESYMETPLRKHLWGFTAGSIYGVGLACSFLCGEDLGFALSHCIGMSSSLVALGWGIFFYFEFAGSSAFTRLLAAMAVSFYAGAVLVLVFAAE